MAPHGTSEFHLKIRPPILLKQRKRYDEGTALMPTVCDKQMLPVSHRYPFMALDEDGYELPSDWLVAFLG